MNTILIVPYRNRPQHLTKFIGHMTTHYPKQAICIVEQEPGKLFNRARLLNIGFLENSKQHTHFIFHDVDMLPMHVNYNITYKTPVIQMAKSEIQHIGYLGGVTRFSKSAFIKVGGYNNSYFHRAEDNEMMFNLMRVNIPFINKFGVFETLEHERIGPEFDLALWEKAKLRRATQNQLSECTYDVLNTLDFGCIKHITVKV